MIRINLIPHREAFRQKQIIEYLTVFVGAVLISTMLIVMVDAWASSDLEALQAKNTTLEAKNRALMKKIGELRNIDSLRSDVEAKLEIVDELQAGRFRSLSTLSAVADAIPQNIWINDLKDNQGSIVLNGFGESSQAVANFMRALEKTDLFKQVQLSVDKSAVIEGANVRQFALSFHRLTLAEQIDNDKVTSEKGGVK